jgi:hypothetical protein
MGRKKSVYALVKPLGPLCLSIILFNHKGAQRKHKVTQRNVMMEIISDEPKWF